MSDKTHGGDIRPEGESAGVGATESGLSDVAFEDRKDPGTGESIGCFTLDCEEILVARHEAVLKDGRRAFGLFCRRHYP